ncbi:MAG: glycosyltransferase family 2 protein [Gammaproteobacteria bacterium]|nr:glycosyltransferase family 2 protein [Gammaproteobacteria bacterium]
MKLSVIIPAYKVAPYIYECVLSLLAQQTNFDFEVLVCNDCSPDNTRQVLAYLESSYSNLKVLDNNPNLGLVSTMSRLLDAASGEYIAYLDGDDLALPGKLQQQVDYLDQHSGCSLVYHESDMFDTVTGDTLRFYSRDNYNFSYIPQQAGILHLIQYGTVLQASSVMFRRHPNLQDALKHGCKIICDYPWHIMNLGFLGGTMDRIDAVLGRYRVHAQSFGGQTAQSSERRLIVTEELISACRLGLKFGIAQDLVTLGINHVYFAASLYFLKLNNTDLFIKMIEQSATDKAFFDTRHQFAWKHREAPMQVKADLGL